MLTRTKRYIIPTGSFESIVDRLEYVNTGSGYIHNVSATTSSCNWNNKVWCDVTFTCDTGSSAAAHMNSTIFITKQIWIGVQEATGSLDDTHDIAFL